jgi:hypothetical protein
MGGSAPALPQAAPNVDSVDRIAQVDCAFSQSECQRICGTHFLIWQKDDQSITHLQDNAQTNSPDLSETFSFSEIFVMPIRPLAAICFAIFVTAAQRLPIAKLPVMLAGSLSGPEATRRRRRPAQPYGRNSRHLKKQEKAAQRQKKPGSRTIFDNIDPILIFGILCFSR